MRDDGGAAAPKHSVEFEPPLTLTEKIHVRSADDVVSTQSASSEI